jgi:hypothetical protein
MNLKFVCTNLNLFVCYTNLDSFTRIQIRSQEIKIRSHEIEKFVSTEKKICLHEIKFVGMNLISFPRIYIPSHEIKIRSHEFKFVPRK